ncbi:MAG: hypothetical protein O3B47_00145 [bacterium]|nr:hypothetical protein [bacterium]
MRSWWKITVLGVIFILFLAIWIFVIGFSSNRPGSFFNTGHNAVWLGHSWVGEEKTDEEIEALVKNLDQNEIDTVFVHSGPFEENGSIDPKTYEYAISFVDRVKAINPNISYQAWLGQIRGNVDLDNADVRHEIAKQSMILSGLVGFDGIHFDIEPVWDGDLAFIELLKESRGLMLEEKTISVALAEFIPQSLIWMTKNIHEFKNYNSEVNYLNVADYADQIVVMAYDTGIDRDWLYIWLVKEQTIWLSNLLDGKELFVGIPAYNEKTEAYDPEIENIENGLKGILAGLNNIRSNENNFAGVAIYPYWEIDDEEWQVYNMLWLR